MLVYATGHRRTVEHRDAVVGPGPMPNDHLNVRAGVKAQRKVSSGWVIQVLPSNKAPDYTVLLAQQELHTREDGLHWVFNTLPYN